MISKTTTAFAPATCGNVCVGYDVLGLCYSNVGDTIRVTKIPEKTVRIKKVESREELPKEAQKNSAGIVLLELIQQENLNFGFSLEIKKGIPLKSGMGGSAASAVGALLAANAFLDKALDHKRLLKLSLKGEEIACGSPHIDNVAPCLYGGLTYLDSQGEIEKIPFPKEISILLIHPHLQVETKAAREVLSGAFSPEKLRQQKKYLENFLKSCRNDDLAGISQSFVDVLTEEHRAPLTQGFKEAKETALNNKALGYSLSGSGPSQICLCADLKTAQSIEKKIVEFYQSISIGIDTFIGPINNEGAKLL